MEPLLNSNLALKILPKQKRIAIIMLKFCSELILNF